MSFPGYTSILHGEGNPEEMAARLDDNHGFLRNICIRVLYSLPEYNVAFNRFFSRLRQRLDEVDNQHPPRVPRRHLHEVATYFYNRQYIIQMMSVPTPFPAANIYIPMSRNPAKQLMVDILAFTADQKTANRNIPYLVSIVDPYTRFIWASPVKQLTASKVRQAFFRAFGRPGLSSEFYTYLRNKVTQVVVDGGGEFKSTFPKNLHHAFPNAALVTSQPKGKTMGRPTSTGPIEAAIGMIRHGLRKYEFTKGRDFLGNNETGLTQVLDMINSATSAPLHDAHQEPHFDTPAKLAQAMMNGNEAAVAHVSALMKEDQTAQQVKRTTVLDRLTGNQPNNPFWLATNPLGKYAYRLYIKPQPFSKLVTIKVSQELYVIKKQNVGEKGNQVELMNYLQFGQLHPNHLDGVVGKIANMQELVLVCAPVEYGPRQQQYAIENQIHALEWQEPVPREVNQAFAVPPEIRMALQRDAPELEEQPHDRIIRPRRQGVNYG